MPSSTQLGGYFQSGNNLHQGLHEVYEKDTQLNTINQVKCL